MKDKIYGIEILSLKEEVALPKNRKKTRNNKINMINQISTMKKCLEVMETRARLIPELDDKGHADLVDEFADYVALVSDMVGSATNFGLSDEEKYTYTFFNKKNQETYTYHNVTPKQMGKLIDNVDPGSVMISVTRD